MTQKYVAVTKLRFRGSNGHMQTIEEHDIVSFDEGDAVDLELLERVGALVRYREPQPEVEAIITVRPEPKPKAKAKTRSKK